jgi:hypothetical protein
MREHGTKVLVDTHGWRFRYDATLDVAKLRSASWAPTSPVSPVDKATGAALVEASLRAQASLQADVYFLPGWLPAAPDEDLRSAYEQTVATASHFDDVPPKPFVLFVGGHTKGLDQVAALLDDLPHFISGIYLQLTPVRPMKDGAGTSARSVGPSRPRTSSVSLPCPVRQPSFGVVASHATG